jgi:meso-butanediol dehydrogenase/(S,S)-butanediol dehydrogenase/diacetyl reductase
MLFVQEVTIPSSIFHLPSSLSNCSLGHRTDLKHQTAIETAMVQPLAGNGAAATTLGAARPWGAFGETRNIAGAAASLASEDAAFVTGVLLPVDGVCC